MKTTIKDAKMSIVDRKLLVLADLSRKLEIIEKDYCCIKNCKFIHELCQIVGTNNNVSTV